MSEKTMNIHQRILAVMGDINYVQKEDKKVNNQYTFVSHDAVSAKLHPKLVEHGITVVPTVREWHQDGNRTDATVDVVFVNADDPQDSVTVTAFGFGIDQGDKGPGKAVSYATKYAMLKLFVLETGDDPEKDANATHVPEETPVDRMNRVLQDDRVAQAVQTIKDRLAQADWDAAAQAWFGTLDDEEKAALWLAPSKGGIFSTHEREEMKSADFRKAYYTEAA